MTAEQLEQVGEGEARQIVHWRFESLVRAGYPERYARVVATAAEADLHLAMDLVRRGCPPELATRILL